MSKIDWGKAPEGYPIWIEDLLPSKGGDGSGWHKELPDKYEDTVGRFWRKPEDSFYRVHLNPNLSWTGEGLPPVGTVCELSSQGADWGIGTIQYTADNVIVWRWENQAVGQACACYKHEIEIRPIRTPEQIAAEERRNAIEEMTARYDGKYGLLADWAAYVYDTLGYRKQGDQS